MPIPGDEMQCDFVWHRERLIVEVDAWETHRSRQSFRGDRRRDRLLRREGWDVVRVTGYDVDGSVDEVVGDVRAMLEQRAAQNSGKPELRSARA